MKQRSLQQMLGSALASLAAAVLPAGQFNEANARKDIAMANLTMAEFEEIVRIGKEHPRYREYELGLLEGQINKLFVAKAVAEHGVNRQIDIEDLE